MNFRQPVVSPKNSLPKNPVSSNLIQDLRGSAPSTNASVLNWSHPMVDLSTLIAHIKSFSDILVLANNGVDWKPDAYNKAMQWALYFEKV
jgi:hypothetical protein